MKKGRIRNLSILFLIVMSGAALRIYNLDRQSIWHDEAREYFRASKSVSDLWKNQCDESNPPAYDILLGCFLRIFNNARDEFRLRLFSAICGILLIPLAFLVGRRIFNVRVGLFFSTLVSISPQQIYYSQDAKMYSFLTLLSLGSFFLYYLSLNKAKAIYWIGYVLAVILLIYTHVYGTLIFFVQIILFFIFYKGGYYNLGAPLVSAITVLLAFIPRILCMMRQLMLDYNPWIPPPSWSAVVQTFTHFCILSWHIQINRPLAAALIIGLVSYGIILGSLIFKGMTAKRTGKDRLKEFRKLTFLNLHLFLPLALVLIVSLKRPIYVAGRYSVILLPFFCLLVSYGLDRIKKDIWRTLLLRCIIVATLVSLYNYYFVFEKSNDRQVAGYLNSRVSSDDIVIFTGLSWPTYDYYRRGEVGVNALLFPDSNLGWLPREALDAEPAYTREQLDKILLKVASLSSDRTARVIVIFINIRINELLIHKLKKHYQFLEVVDFKPGRCDSQVSAVYFFRNKYSPIG